MKISLTGTDAIQVRESGVEVSGKEILDAAPDDVKAKAHRDAIQLIPPNKVGDVYNMQMAGTVLYDVAVRDNKVKSDGKLQCVFCSDGLVDRLIVEDNTLDTNSDHFISVSMLSGTIRNNRNSAGELVPVRLFPLRVGGNSDGKLNVYIVSFKNKQYEYAPVSDIVKDDTLDHVTDHRFGEGRRANSVYLHDFDLIAFQEAVVASNATPDQMRELAFKFGSKEEVVMAPMKGLTPYEVGQLQQGQRELKGGMNNPVIVEYFKATSYHATDDETPWCLEGDIEVLTDKGFVRFDQFKYTDVKSVAQLNTETHSVFFTDQFDYIEKDYKGVVYDVNAGHVNFTCDPKHRLYGRWTGTGKDKAREVNTLTSYGVYIPSIESSEVGIDCTDDELTFMAAYLSDGHQKSPNSLISFGVSKQRKIDVLDSLPYRAKSEDSVVYGVANKPITRYVFGKECLRTDYLQDYKSLTWEFISRLSKDQAYLFINAYKVFDGTPSNETGSFNEGGFEVFTQDKQLQEQLHYIATMAGYKCTPYSVKQVSANTAIEYLHHVYVSPEGKRRGIKKKDITEREFDGKLYCLSVPTTVMIIRCRGGVVMPIGNCSAVHCWVHEQAGVAHTKSAAACSWKDWGTGINKPVKGCTIVADHGNGRGHVGFYVGETSDAYVIMGGNQNDEYNVIHYPKSATYKWFFRKRKTSVNSKTNWAAGTGAAGGASIVAPSATELLKDDPVVEEKPTVPPVSEQICEMQECPVKIPEGYKAVPEDVYEIGLGIGLTLIGLGLFVIYERCKKINLLGV